MARKTRAERRQERRELEAMMTAIQAAQSRYFGTLNPGYITELSALENEAVYSASSTIADMIACFPMVIMERTSKGNIPAGDYPVQKLLNSPNGENVNQSGIDFWSAYLMNLLVKGNGYAHQNRRNARAVTQSMELMKPGHMEVYRSPEGKIRYKHTPNEAAVADYSSLEVFHVSGPTYDGIVGLSPIELFRNNFIESLNVDNYVSNYFKKGIFSNLVYEFPDNATASKEKIKFIKKKFSQLFGGLENSGEPMVVDFGTKIHEFKGSTNKDAEIVNLRKEAVLKVARIYKLPPHMLGILDDANYSNVTVMNSQFYKVTLLPWICRVESAINNQLIPPYDRDRYFCKINAKAILRGDDKERSAYYKTMKNLGAFSVNDILELEDRPRLDTSAADYHMYPLNESALEKFDELQKKENQDSQDKEEPGEDDPVRDNENEKEENSQE